MPKSRAGDPHTITIARTDCDFEREPLLTPFGFKGGTLTELWQTVAGLGDGAGNGGVGVGVQSVLWSDAAVFATQAEAAGNSLMFQLTAHALRLAEGRAFSRPEELFDQLLPEVLGYGRALSGRPDLRHTFALNALVPVDNAAWQLYSAASRTRDFDTLASPYRSALRHRHGEIAAIPVVGYTTPLAQIGALLHEGSFILKIKIGGPGPDDDRAGMLAWDCGRLSEIHEMARRHSTRHTASGRIAYYLDANGRYDSPDRVRRLLDHCERIGMLKQVLLLEEPFPEEFEHDVRDLPVRVTVDESAHSVADVVARLDAGYRAVALKPVAKTLSLSLRMAAAAQARGVPCFCADLTANPVLVDWGKTVAARLAPLPGLAMGALESNGSQNYAHWPRLKSFHPFPEASWIEPRGGLFTLDDDFYMCSGGILTPSSHYAARVPAIFRPGAER